jgi:hypothetical protein
MIKLALFAEKSGAKVLRPRSGARPVPGQQNHEKRKGVYDIESSQIRA